ncbi:unnamed protein product, partial [Prorocentrum cordatum]
FSFSPQSNAVRKSRAARKEQHRDRHTHSHSQPLKAPCGYGWPNSPSAERKTRGDRPSEVVVKNVQRSVLRWGHLKRNPSIKGIQGLETGGTRIVYIHIRRLQRSPKIGPPGGGHV